MQRLIHITRQTIKHHRLFTSDDTLLVALSGGADSVALLLVLQELGYHIEALHCNFHLRSEESDRDESFVRSLCQQHNIPLWVKHFDTLSHAKANKVSIEMAARDLRYAWFNEMLQERQASSICVAHHQQDQAETLLLNLVRGTGLRGLAGMHYKNGNIVRPLLDASKSDILNYLQERGQSWVEDSTNQERDAQRNRIRLDILPLLQDINPKAIEHLAQTATHIQESLPIYEAGLNVSTLPSVSPHSMRSTYPITSTLTSISPHSMRGISPITSTLPSISPHSMRGSSPIFTAPTLTQLHEHLHGCGFTQTQERDIFTATTGSVVESSTHRLLKDRDQFILQDKNALPPLPEITMQVIPRNELSPMQPGIAYFDNDTVHYPLTVRFLQSGDRITPFGMTGSRLVSNLLTDLKFTLFEKERTRIVTDASGRILCLPGIRSSNHCRVTVDTQQVLIMRSSILSTTPVIIES